MQSDQQIPNFVINLGTVEKINQIVHNFSDFLFVVMFTSPWCGACKSYLPIFEKAQKKFNKEGIIFAKVDVNDLPEVAQQFKVMGTPTTIFIKNQKVKGKQVGMVTMGKINDLINQYIN